MLPVGSWDTPFSSKGLDKFILTEAFLKWLMKTPSDHSEMRVRGKKTNDVKVRTWHKTKCKVKEYMK